MSFTSNSSSERPTQLAVSTVADSTVLRVLAALTGGFQRTADSSLRTVFETEVQRELQVRSVRLRELPSRRQARLVTPSRTAESLVLAIPTRDPVAQVVLEVNYDAHRPPSQNAVQALLALTHVAGLVMDSSRCEPPPPRAAGADTGGWGALVGSSPVMAGLRDRIERVAATNFTALIQGESGTGKELVARQIHEQSRRRRGPFVAVNCAAIVDTLLEAELFGIEERTATGVRGRRGKFEHADGGTLFLDEIGDLSLAAQAKLLRAIQDLSVERVGTTGTRRVDIRVLAATNRPLADMVAKGLFRADLYYRLSGVEIHVPPLRVRRDDLRELAIHFLRRHRPTDPPVLAEAAVDALLLYQWPGNVRELERVIERALALTSSDRIELDDLPPQVRGEYATVLGPSLVAGDTMRAWGSRYAQLVFERCGGNKRRTCKLLDISYHTLRAYLRYARPDPDDPPTKLPAWVRSTSSHNHEG
jgi:transcriptional regulator with PAS, ATPase and Fis domain